MKTHWRMLVTLAGCSSCVAAPYTESAWRRVGGPANRAGLAVGCVDVALSIAAVQDAPRDQVVIGFTLGNRCDARVLLRFNAISVRTRHADGTYRAVTRVPPPVGGSTRWAFRWWLDARELYVPWVLYGGVVTLSEVTMVCVDLSGLVDGAAPVVQRCLTVPRRHLLAAR